MLRYDSSVRDTLLPFSPPSIGDEEVDEVAATLRGEWLTTGPRAKRFEEEVASYVAAEAALAVSWALRQCRSRSPRLGLARVTR